MYLCTRPDNDASKTCRFPYDVEISAEFEYNNQIEVNPNNRYELLPHIVGAKGPIYPTTGKGIGWFAARKHNLEIRQLVFLYSPAAPTAFSSFLILKWLSLILFLACPPPRLCPPRALPLRELLSSVHSRPLHVPPLRLLPSRALPLRSRQLFLLQRRLRMFCMFISFIKRRTFPTRKLCS